MRLVEFIIKSNNLYNIILIDVNDISNIEKIDLNSCKIVTKTLQSYIVVGTYRTLTNRFIYGLSKKHNYFDDDVMRPSILVFHRPEHIGVEQSMSDIFQVHGFISALIPEEQLNLFYTKLDPYLLELFKQNNLIH